MVATVPNQALTLSADTAWDDPSVPLDVYYTSTTFFDAVSAHKREAATAKARASNVRKTLDSVHEQTQRQADRREAAMAAERAEATEKIASLESKLARVSKVRGVYLRVPRV